MLGRVYLNAGFVNLSQVELGSLGQITTAHNQRVERSFKQAAQYTGTYQVAQRGLGFVLLARGDKAGLVAAWQEAQIPASSLLVFGENMAEQRQWDEALIWYECAAQLDFALSANALAGLLHEQKNYAAAIQVWQQALDDFPEHPQRQSWWRGLASSFGASRQWNKAMAVSRTALSEFPKDAALLTTLGNAVYYNGEDIDMAIEIVQRAIASDNDFAEAYAVMGKIMAIEKRYDKAYSWYSKAIERNPNVNWWHVVRANMARNMGDLAQAIALYQDIIDHYPGYAGVYFEIAWAYHLNNELELAMIAIEQAIELSPPNIDYYFRAGSIYEQAGKMNDALTMYQNVLKIAPNHEAAKVRLQRLEETIQKH